VVLHEIYDILNRSMTVELVDLQWEGWRGVVAGVIADTWDGCKVGQIGGGRIESE
jgi:hypothetical protein